MKRFILILFIIVTFNAGFSQTPDSLKKYSYMVLVYASSKKIPVIGTCFFYKKGRNLYAVSNYHVWGGSNPYTNEKNGKADSVFILFKHKDILRNIPVTGNSNPERFFFFERPDLYAYKIEQPPGVKFNYINDLIDESYFNNTPDIISFYGYPGHENLIHGDDMIIKAVHSKLVKPEFREEIIKTTLFSEFPGEPGMSGSPVFAKFIKNNKTIYKFYGVYIAHIGIPEIGAFINGHFAMSYLNNLP